MHAIDTNVLVRLIVRDNPAETATAENFIRGGVWASALAIAETAWVLGSVYGLRHTELADAIGMLLDEQDLVLGDRDAVEAALRLFQGKPSLGFSDCLILELARKAGHLPMGTFDRKLAKVEGVQRL